MSDLSSQQQLQQQLQVAINHVITVLGVHVNWYWYWVHTAILGNLANTFQTVGSRYHGYRRVLYTTVLWYVPVL